MLHPMCLSDYVVTSSRQETPQIENPASRKVRNEVFLHWTEKAGIKTPHTSNDVRWEKKKLSCKTQQLYYVFPLQNAVLGTP